MLKTLGARWLDYQIDWVEKIMRSLLIVLIIHLISVEESFHFVLGDHTLWIKLIVLISLLYSALMFMLCAIQSIRYKTYKKQVQKNLQNQKKMTKQTQEYSEVKKNIALLKEELDFSKEILVASKEKQRHVLLSSYLFMIGLCVLALLWYTGINLAHHMQWNIAPSMILAAYCLMLLLFATDTLVHTLSRKKDHIDDRFAFLKACYFAILNHEPTLEDPDWLATQKINFQNEIQMLTSSNTLKKIEAYRATIASWKKKTQQNKSYKQTEQYACDMLNTLDKLVIAYHQKTSLKKRFIAYIDLVFKGILLPIADVRHIGALVSYYVYILLPQSIRQRSDRHAKKLFCDKLFDLHATFS